MTPEEIVADNTLQKKTEDPAALPPEAEEEKKYTRSQLALVSKKAREDEQSKSESTIAELQAKIDGLSALEARQGNAQTPVESQIADPMQQQQQGMQQQYANQQPMQQQAMQQQYMNQHQPSADQMRQEAKAEIYNEKLLSAMEADPEFKKDYMSLNSMIPQDLHNNLANSGSEDSAKIINYLMKNPEMLTRDPNSAIAAARAGISTLKPEAESTVHGQVSGEEEGNTESAYDEIKRTRGR